MFKKIRFFQKFKKLIFGSFAIVTGLVSCCLLGSWTNNDDDFIDFDNYFLLSQVSNWSLDTAIVNHIDATNSTYDYDFAVDNNNYYFTITDSNLFYNEYFYKTQDLLTGLYYVFMVDINSFNIPYGSFLYFYPSIRILSSEHSSLSYDLFNNFNYEFTSNFYINLTNDSDGFSYSQSFINPLTNGSVVSPSHFNSNTICDSTFNATHLYFDFEVVFDDEDFILNNEYDTIEIGLTNTMLCDYSDLSINDVSALSEYYTNQYVSQLQSNYDEQLSTLQDDYDTLNNQYQILQQRYNELDDSFARLETRYEDLQENYNDLINNGIVNKDNYHIWIASQNTSQTSWDFTKVQQLDSSTYIDDLGYMDISGIYTSYINGTNNTILVELDNSLNVLNYDLMFNITLNGSNINLLMQYDNFNPVYRPLYGLNSSSSNGETLSLSNFIKYNDSLYDNLLNYTYNAFAIVYTNLGNDLANIKLNGQGDYNLGYANGLAQNNRDFIDLQQNYDDLNSSYNTLESNFENLQQRYNDLANTDLGFSMSKLMWNIASTPFESFKSIWSVNFLDFNIASFITGILSIFVIVWLLKKIF